ncbi:MAG TPA: DNA-binding response regulator [Chloroflexi bacterium]|nr:DNA-binding response regulator [Chloroflexota bacterium]
MTETIRLMIADDHLIVREGLRLILETEPGFALIGEAADGAEAVQLATELQPDVILMDLRMPRVDGLSAIQQLRQTQPQIAIVILTTFNEDDLMRQGLQAGARGYLLKDTDRATLFHTIRAAARGETLLKPEILQKLLNQPQIRAESPAPETVSDLTAREIEVLESVALGETSKQIALHLGITERTVKAHLTSIYQKLGVDSRAAAVSEAMKLGILGE